MTVIIGVFSLARGRDSGRNGFSETDLESDLQRLYPQPILATLLGGTSAIDIPRLDITNLQEARDFVSSYGYDLDDPVDVDRVWKIHLRAVTFIKENFLDEGEEIPAILVDPAELKDVAYLILFASTRDSQQNHLQRWSCAILVPIWC